MQENHRFSRHASACLLALTLLLPLPAAAKNQTPPPKTGWGYTVNGGCECGNGRYCTGPRGGKYCLRNGKKQYL